MATITVSAKCSDMCFVRWPNGKTSDGYVPHISGLGGGDYVKITIDIETGKVIGWDVDSVNQAMLDQFQDDEEEEEFADEEYGV